MWIAICLVRRPIPPSRLDQGKGHLRVVVREPRPQGPAPLRRRAPRRVSSSSSSTAAACAALLRLQLLGRWL